MVPFLNCLSVFFVDGTPCLREGPLGQVVDRHPYSSFQLFRAPYACKLRASGYAAETALEPEALPHGSELALFASHCDAALAAPLVPLEARLADPLLEGIDGWRARASHGGCTTAPLDAIALWDPAFQQGRARRIDLRSLHPVQQFEASLGHLHPQRATQWWTWFRLCGICCQLLEQYSHDQHLSDQTWAAFVQWSSQYPHFDEEENWQ